MEGLQLVLENNYFFFDDEYYIQITVGFKVAPIYVTLVLDILEEKMYDETQDETQDVFGAEFANYIKKINGRVTWTTASFFFWNRSRDDLLKFQKLPNELHKNIHY